MINSGGGCQRDRYSVNLALKNPSVIDDLRIAEDIISEAGEDPLAFYKE